MNDVDKNITVSATKDFFKSYDKLNKRSNEQIIDDEQKYKELDIRNSFSGIILRHIGIDDNDIIFIINSGFEETFVRCVIKPFINVYGRELSIIFVKKYWNVIKKIGIDNFWNKKIAEDLWRAVNKIDYTLEDAKADCFLFNSKWKIHDILVLVIYIEFEKITMNSLSKLNEYNTVDDFLKYNVTNNDTSEITSIINNFIENNKEKIEEYKNGNKKLFNVFVGQIVKNNKGINPKIINEELNKILNICQ